MALYKTFIEVKDNLGVEQFEKIAERSGVSSIGELITDANVSGAYDLDVQKSHDLTMTDETDFTLTNLPPIGKRSVIAVRLSGAHPFSFTNAGAVVVGEYNSDEENLLAIDVTNQKIWININSQ